MVSSEGSRPISHGMARDELLLLWQDTVREDGLSVPNPTSALEGALTIRCDFADPLFVADRRTRRKLNEQVARRDPVSCRNKCLRVSAPTRV